VRGGEKDFKTQPMGGVEEGGAPSDCGKGVPGNDQDSYGRSTVKNTFVRPRQETVTPRQKPKERHLWTSDPREETLRELPAAEGGKKAGDFVFGRGKRGKGGRRV